MLDAADLPNDVAELKTLLIAATAREARKDDRIERLEKLVAAFKQAAFGRKSEKINSESSSIWHWKIWKLPSRRSMQRTKRMLLRTAEFANPVQSIEVLCQSTCLALTK